MKKLIFVSVIGLLFSCKDNKSQDNYKSDSLSVANGQNDSLSTSSTMNNTSTSDSSNLNSSTASPNDSLSRRKDSVRRR
ncbi:hypothetical protein [Epilithonimonas hominis]|uniref:Lipoprotein n=1 Tax=Epilithonimonas hominis TaxID=420404 RepID=A0A1H6LRX9_9FLAO|nr:hypothetical protein [Epilithonimonas hominis]SEH87734.1 hypothetical protein SAMN05421793_1445 [Epilithonimonas hominis]